MNFNSLKIYVIVYEQKSLNKSAKILKYTQANLPKILKNMENELNTILFERTKQGLLPTENGKLMYDFALKTINTYANLKSDMTSHKPKLLISELLLDFKLSNYPDYLNENSIIISSTNDIQEKIHRETYDHILCFNKLNTETYKKINQNVLPVSLMCSNDTKNINLPIVVNADKTCPLRNISYECSTKQFEIIEVDSLQIIINLVQHGKALAYLPKYLEEKLKLKSIDNRYIDINYYEYKS